MPGSRRIKTLEAPSSIKVTSSGGTNAARQAKGAERSKIELTFDGSPEQ